jgi:glycosyltransferase involved in cell wall biosynthesis
MRSSHGNPGEKHLRILQGPVLPVLVGPFPGPVHGVSVINAKLAERMAAGGIAPLRIDLAPPAGARGLAYHLTRAARTLAGIARILTAGRRRYVISLDGGWGLFYNLLLAVAARLRGQGLAYYHHSTAYVLADSILMRALVAVAGPGAPQIFCSPAMAKLFAARYGGGGTLIIGNAAWVDPVAPGAGSSDGLQLGFLSTLTLEKGLGRAIETLRLLRGRGLAARLDLAGPVVDAAAGTLLAQAQAEFGGTLRLNGVLSGAEKAAFYGGLDVFLFASLYPHETQSLVVPEALAAGTPVVAYDHRFVGEVLGQGGLLIPPGQDFAAEASSFILASDSEVRAKRRAAALAQFETERTRAQGQVERLIAWACGREAP